MEKLIEEAKAGNKEAFTQIVKIFEKDLYRIANTKLKNNEDICDAIQNTMIIVFKNIKKLKKNKYFKTWLIKILINECNKIMKYNLKNNKFIEESTLEILENETKSEIKKDDFLSFNSIISGLESDEQLIFSLYYKDKFSCEEISKITKLSTGTIKSKLCRGRKKVANCLNEEVLNENG